MRDSAKVNRALAAHALVYITYVGEVIVAQVFNGVSKSPKVTDFSKFEKQFDRRRHAQSILPKTCMYTCIHVCVYVCIYVCMYACIYACISYVGPYCRPYYRPYKRRLVCRYSQVNTCIDPRKRTELPLDIP